MARRDPFERLKRPLSPQDGAAQPLRPIDLIPRPKRRTRSREWEKRNPAHHYRVPADMAARARTVRKAIVGLAQRYQSTADDVASALMGAALAAVQEGEIRLDFRPNPKGRKMTVEIVRGDGWAQGELPKPKPRKKTEKPVILTYRWGKDIHKSIMELAEEAPKGAVVALLLEAALERVKAGKWGLRPRPVAVKQDVTVARSRKNRG